MPRFKSQGFTVYTTLRKTRLAVRRELSDLTEARRFISEMARLRPIGAEGLWIVDERTGLTYQGTVEPLVAGGEEPAA